MKNMNNKKCEENDIVDDQVVVVIGITILYDNNSCDIRSIKSIQLLLSNIILFKTIINIVNINENKWMKELKDVVILPGGEPKAFLKALGRNRITILKQYVNEGGRMVGICSGACVIYKMNLLDKCISLVNDNIWADSGLVGDVKTILSVDSSISCYSHYENGPLFRVKRKKGIEDVENVHITSVYEGDVVEIQNDRIATQEKELSASSSTSSSSWICKCCTCPNNSKRSKCIACKEKKNHKLPPLGDMPGSIASLRCENIYVFSFHPEFSQQEIQEWFEREMLTFVS